MKKTSTCLRFLSFIWWIICFAPGAVFGQLDIDVSTTENTNCDGVGCDFTGPSILINELMLSPLQYDGSLWGSNASQAGEWIELYNPNICEEIDISCYYLGNNANDPTPHPGGYAIPPGTVVPPSGFALIRGVNAPPVANELLVENGGNVVELVVVGDGACVGEGNRLWFPNAGGWFAFYNSEGVPQDAVSWGNQSNLDEDPCVPELAGCGPTGSLPNYNDFPADRKSNILNVSAANFQGQSIRRLPDGGTWSGAGTPTYATCNAGCVDPGSICNGTASASVQPSGGTPPYSFLWDDPLGQTTPTANNLCAGTYCVTISDAVGNTAEYCMEVENAVIETELEDGFCEGDTYTLPNNSVVDEGGDYAMTFTNISGCDSLVVLHLDMHPNFDIFATEAICNNQTFTLPDGTATQIDGEYFFEYQTIHGCDSTLTIHLSILPPVDTMLVTHICPGTSYVLPDGSAASDAGVYEVLIQGGAEACDTLYTVELHLYDAPIIAIDQINDITCFGASDGNALISISGGTGPFDIEWSDGTAHGLAPASLAAGDYNVLIADGNGCQADTVFSISEPPLLEITASADTLICIGDETQMFANASGGTGTITYHWSHTASTDSETAASPVANTVYTVSASDENGCSSEVLILEVEIIAMDSGLLTLAGDTAICEGENTSITSNYAGTHPPYTYQWTHGLPSVSGPHAVSPAETTTYTLTVSDACGSSLTGEVTVEVYPLPEAQLPDELLQGCAPLEIELFDPIQAESGNSHEWIVAGHGSVFDNPASFTLSDPGLYEVTLMVTSPQGCVNTSEASLPIEVFPVPVANFEASSWTAYIDNPLITFTNVGAGYTSGTWLIDGSEYHPQPEISYTFPDTGSYAVQLVVENEFGCRDSIVSTVTIGVVYDVVIPNAFTPTRSGDNPNFDPASTSNTVFYPFSEYVSGYRMSIFNRWGELIFESSEIAMGWNGTYRGQPCPQDVYVYKIDLEFSDGHKATKVGDITLFR